MFVSSILFAYLFIFSNAEKQQHVSMASFKWQSYEHVMRLCNIVPFEKSSDNLKQSQNLSFNSSKDNSSSVSLSNLYYKTTSNSDNADNSSIEFVDYEAQNVYNEKNKSLLTGNKSIAPYETTRIVFIECVLFHIGYQISLKDAYRKQGSIQSMLTSWWKSIKNFFYELVLCLSNKFGKYEFLIIIVLIVMLMLCLFILMNQLLPFISMKKRTLITVHTFDKFIAANNGKI